MKRTLRSPKSRTSSIVLLVLSLTMALSAATPMAAADESPGKDPVVQDVIRMLAAGVEPTLVEQWLVRNKVRPKHVSADDLIELTKVKAPGSLVDLLMRMAAGELPAAAAPAPAPGASAAPTSTTAPSSTPPTLVPPSGGMPAAPAAMADASPAQRGDVPTTFTIDYKPESNEFESPWTLFVYVNGRPLVATEGGSAVSFAFAQETRFSVPLKPGRHVIGLTQERHALESRRRGTWRHEARALPLPIVLNVPTATNAEIEIVVDERVLPTLRDRGPVSYSLTVNGEISDVKEHIGPVTSRWPSLCEEVETRFDADDRGKSSFREAMRGCVRWATLFPEVTDAPTRDAVRDELRQYEFRPQPVGAR